MGQIGYSSGFGFQSTYGTWHSNFEVYLPWPDGGFAQFWHDGVKWNGPVVIAGRPLASVAAYQSRFKSKGGSHGNFELAAVTAAGDIEIWWRDSKSLTWTFGTNLSRPRDDLGQAVERFRGIAFGRHHILDEDTPEPDYILASSYGGEGLRIYQRNSTTTHQWDDGDKLLQLRPNETGINVYGGDPVTGDYDGLGWALGTVGDTRNDFDEAGNAQAVLAACKVDGSLTVRQTTPSYFVGGGGQAGATAGSTMRVWEREDVIGHEVRGRPAVIQSDRNYRRGFFIFAPAKHGNYELVAPLAAGGFAYYVRNNNTGLTWNYQGAVGTEVYDEVALLQDNGERVGDRTGALHVFAWQRGAKWFHEFIQYDWDGGMRWVGPTTVGQRVIPRPAPERWDITCARYGRQFNQPRYVYAVGGVRNGQPWTLSTAQVISMILNGTHEFRTVAPDGSTAAVRVGDWHHRTDPGAVPFNPNARTGYRGLYLTTAADNKLQNNLLHLPACP